MFCSTSRRCRMRGASPRLKSTLFSAGQWQWRLLFLRSALRCSRFIFLAHSFLLASPVSSRRNTEEEGVRFALRSSKAIFFRFSPATSSASNLQLKPTRSRTGHRKTTRRQRLAKRFEHLALGTPEDKVNRLLFSSSARTPSLQIVNLLLRDVRRFWLRSAFLPFQPHSVPFRAPAFLGLNA